MKTPFEADYKPMESRPDEPIKVGRESSQARISVLEAKELVDQLLKAIKLADLDAYRKAMTPEINPEDISISVYCEKPRSGWDLSPCQGVKIIHLPTGIETKSASERSQHRNRHVAIEELKEKLRGFKNG